MVGFINTVNPYALNSNNQTLFDHLNQMSLQLVNGIVISNSINLN